MKKRKNKKKKKENVFGRWQLEEGCLREAEGWGGQRQLRDELILQEQQNWSSPVLGKLEVGVSVGKTKQFAQ